MESTLDSLSEPSRDVDSPRHVRRIGLFGGTFDPPHFGHLAVARAARDQLGLDEVLLVVAGDPWQKRDRSVTRAALRLELTELLIAGERGLRVDAREIARSGPSYTIDTVEELLVNNRERIEITLVVGVDAAQGMDTWHRAIELSRLVKVAVAPRPGCAPLELGTSWQVEMLEGLDNPCASTDLRESRRGTDFLRQCLPESIVLRLAQEGLYDVGNGH